MAGGENVDWTLNRLCSNAIYGAYGGFLYRKIRHSSMACQTELRPTRIK